MKARTLFVSLASIAVLLGRVFIIPRLSVPTIEGSYEAFAHMLVGFLVMLPLYESSPRATRWAKVGWVLALWELGWFIAQKYLGL